MEIDPRLQAILDQIMANYPKVQMTSGVRTEQQNTAAGGAKGSQHLQGNAADLNLSAYSPEEQAQIAEALRKAGATGFGFYPKSGSLHADIGTPRYWGPNYSKTSLPETPPWFQQFAGVQGPIAPTAAGTTQMASAQPSAPPQKAPVYSPDLLTSLSRIGNKIMPDLVAAPTPLTPDQQAIMKTQQGQIADAGKAFAQLAALAAPQEMPRLLPPIEFQRRKQQLLQYPRGLL